MNEQTIFTAALERHPDQRSGFLDEACGTDQELRQRVEKLLQLHENAGSFLDFPAGDASPTLDQPVTEKPGTQIGPYKLLQEIGEGGMGVVYLAEQHEPVKRRVGLKLIKPGMDTRQVIARFAAERQALAMMDHPNIAKVFDCGTSQTGRPYFVMELVKGVPITRYCDDNHLTPRERLELFVPICQAIQHAHQKGIIHRDIKPSNILVAEYDHKPVPKIIDFGVAKALNQQLTEKTMFTGLGQVVGTIEYMSPEQARVNQLDVDTRSDVYSLGVLLYELLTGVTPFDKKRLHAAALDELLRIIRDEEPPRPSTRLSTIDTLPSVAANRHIEPRKLSALLHGELDWIVMKALEKDRARRYETANGFANDIQRYLNDEAVQACPPSARYRFGKFARRNKVAIATGAMIAAALVIGIIGTGWQAIRATRAESKAEMRLLAETRARKEADDAHAEAEISKQAALKARDEAQTEATRANHVVRVLKSIFSSHDPRDQFGVPTNYTVAQLFTDLADRLPFELSKEPAVEAEIRSIIGRALSRHDSLGVAYPHFAEAQRLRESIYPPDHPIHIESLFDLLDFYMYLGNYSKANQVADQILSRAQAIDGHGDLKVRAYAAWMQRNENAPEVIDLGSEALKIANANNDNNDPAVMQIKRVLISRRLTELIRNIDRPSDFDDQLRAIESAAEQLLATCENALGKQHAETVLILQLLANIQRIQGRQEAVKDLVIRAFKTNLDHSLFLDAMSHIGELRGLGLPESEFEQLIDRDSWFSDFYYRVEAINRLYDNDTAGYQSLIKKLLQRNASRGTEGLAAVALAAFFSDSATDDWTVLRDVALSSLDPQDPDPRFAGILYRSNDLHKAIEFLEKFDQVFNENGTGSMPGVESSYFQLYRWYNWLFLSMAHYRLGNREQSREYFIRVAAQIPRFLKLYEFGAVDWHRKMVSVLYREAFETIEFDPDQWIVDPTNKMELVGRAELYLLNNQKQKALLDYSAAVELDPENERFRRIRAELYKSAGRFQEAIADLSKAIELNPTGDQGDAQHLRGVAWMGLDQYERALDDLDRAIELAPDRYWYYKHRAVAHFHLAHFEAALADLGRAADYDPNDASTLVWIDPGLVAQCPDESFKTGLLEVAGRLIDVTGNKVEAHVNRARLLVALDQPEKAVADYGKAIELDPNNADRYRDRGMVFLKLLRFDEALADFDRLTTLDENSDAWMYRAAVFRAMGDDDRAQAELDKNLKNSSNKAQSWFDYAMALHNARMLDAAIDAHKKAAEFEQARPIATYNLACAYSLKNEIDNAFDALNRAIEYGFSDASLVSTDSDLANLRDDDRFEAIVAKMQWGTWYESGIAKANAGDNKQAIADLTKAIELNPKFVLALYQRGQLYNRTGDEEKAAADFDRYNAALDAAVTENPSDWQAVNRRGIALYNTRRWDEAIADFERAMELAPDESVLVHNRATCLLEQQQWAEAAKDLARVIEMGEANWQVHYHLALARLGAGDEPGYREACRGMVAALADTQDPLTANFVAWTCTLAPEGLEDWQPALKLARLAAEAQADSLQNQNTLGTLLMRAGQTDEAIKVLSVVAGHLDKPDVSANTSPAYTWYALALAHKHAGSDEQALENLNKANASTDAALTEEANPPAWNRRLTLQLLRKEAETAIGVAETNLPDTNPKPEEAKSAGTR